MKNIFLTLAALFVSQLVFAQSGRCLVHVTLASPGTVALMAHSELQDSKATSAESADFDLEAENGDIQFFYVKVVYNGTTGRKADILPPILLYPGKVDVALSSAADSVLRLQISGPPPVRDYQLKLYGPVTAINSQLVGDRLKLKLARKIGSLDTVKYLQDMKAHLEACYDVPRQYVRSHPADILSVQALKMMGKGDPSLPDPTPENKLEDLRQLFNSLDEKIRESSPGKAYQAQVFDNK